jgi:hypothetical protein
MLGLLVLGVFVGRGTARSAGRSDILSRSSITHHDFPEQTECLKRALSLLGLPILGKGKHATQSGCHRGGFQCGTMSSARLQAHRYWMLASQPNVERVCETGIFEGSAAVWLCATKRVKLAAFDLDLHPVAAIVLPAMFPGRVNLTKGSSVLTLPEFVRTASVKCDVVSVDGGHFGHVPLHDLYNFARVARPGVTALVMDEVSFLPPREELGADDELGRPTIANVTWMHSRPGERACCPDATLAWRYALQTGLIRQSRCYEPSEQHGRGWCEGIFMNTSVPGWEELGMPSYR